MQEMGKIYFMMNYGMRFSSFPKPRGYRSVHTGDAEVIAGPLCAIAGHVPGAALEGSALSAFSVASLLMMGSIVLIESETAP